MRQLQGDIGNFTKQSQKAVTVDFLSKPLLSFGFAEHNWAHQSLPIISSAAKDDIWTGSLNITNGPITFLIASVLIIKPISTIKH